ncbi:MAG: tagaturonate epimerase family protein [Chloroflexota bacterium]
MVENRFSVRQTEQGRFLYVIGSLPTGFHGEMDGDIWRCPLDAANAAAIQKELPWAAPERVGLRKSVGCGDRLGIATPGHLRAIREGEMFPVLAQQSIREMQRAQRSPQQVLDDAMWGIIQADYRDGWGCDADHLKDIESVDACVAAGYLGYTLDPGAFVDDEANEAMPAELEQKAIALPWQELQTTYETNAAFHSQRITRINYLRAAAKYGRALAHVLYLTRRIQSQLQDFDLEISVDETNTVTTLAEHRYIVEELRRLDIPFTGIAPRFVGEFEKGVDYIGDLKQFETQYEQHVALAHELGGYKLSIHSGSDKFSIYPIVARFDLVHLKTAGTSWVEALRVIAEAAPDLFRRILDLAIEGYTTNRASYHVSGEVSNIRRTADLATLIDQFDAREVLHVSFGPVLAQFRTEIYQVLYANYEDYLEVLHRHFRRHILPFSTISQSS